MKTKIEAGYTNQSYKVDDKVFMQEKKYNGFNHKINYELLSKLDFVPKLIENDQDIISWEWIDSKEIILDDKLLIQVAKNLKTLHDSKLEFPKNNLAARVKNYQKIIREKGLKIPVIDKYFRRINNILAKSLKNRPLHNDLFTFNFLIDKNDKLYFVDWEYATMGDKHFDLAYFICSAHLTKEQEEVFLNEYDSYWEEYLIQQKILVYYLVILWVNAQPVKYFDDAFYIEKLEETAKEFEYKKTNKLFKE